MSQFGGVHVDPVGIGTRVVACVLMVSTHAWGSPDMSGLVWYWMDGPIGAMGLDHDE
ncbi:MAG: hypothetical protein VXY56_09420 [Pseudomonadota bacterium]|nr:hypothetical protein [Pseudomonadota bacterium]